MDARILTIWGRNGAGKTTLAVNLACALSQERCVGLISSNPQYGQLPIFFGQEITEPRGLLNALENPGRTKECFQSSGGLTPNLFLLSVPNHYSGLLADNISQSDVEQMLDRVRTCFEILIVDGCEEITNPISSVALTQSKQILTVHKPSVASGLWAQSMNDFVYQLHLSEKILPVIQEAPWSIQPGEYMAALEIASEFSFPHIPHAQQLEDSGLPIWRDDAKSSRRYQRELMRLIQSLKDREVFL